MILLDKVRDDISENKKLNYHLYMALKKSLYKPGAFFKGFLFPLCQVCPPKFPEVNSVERELHTQRSRHRRLCSLESLCSRPSFRRSTPFPLRNALHRSKLSHDPNSSRERICSAL